MLANFITQLQSTKEKKKLWNEIFESLHAFHDDAPASDRKLKHEQVFLMLLLEWGSLYAAEVFFKQYPLPDFKNYLNTLIQTYNINYKQAVNIILLGSDAGNINGNIIPPLVAVILDYLADNESAPIAVLTEDAKEEEISDEESEEDDENVRNSLAMLIQHGPFYRSTTIEAVPVNSANQSSTPEPRF